MSAEPRRPVRSRGGPRVFESGSSPDPFQVLVAEHAFIRLHLARTRDAARQGAGVLGSAFAALEGSYRLHERREDLVLYPVCERLFGGPESVAAVLRQDHEAIRRSLDRVLAECTRADSAPMATLDEVQRLLEDHFAKEERVLFPLITAYLLGKESRRLARQLRETKLA